MTKEAFLEVDYVEYVSSDVVRACPACGAKFNEFGGRIASEINHLMKAHSYRLLHVGQESDLDSEGRPYQKTVAVLGKRD